jgi:hypothetical protein
MQEIVCSQCQSQNSPYTKLCLTCGATMKVPMKREAAPVTANAVKKEEESPAQGAAENNGWLSGLKKFWIF